MAKTTTWTSDELTREASRRLQGKVLVDEPATEVAIPVRTLRYYRSVGLLSPPIRRVRRKWLFEERHVLELMAIRRLQLAGWDLGRIGDALAVTRDQEGLLKALADPREDEIPEGLLRDLERIVGSVEHPRHRESREAGVDAGPKSLEQPAVVSTKLAPGVYLVVDRGKNRLLEPRVAYEVGEQVAALLAGHAGPTSRDQGGMT